MLFTFGMIKLFHYGMFRKLKVIVQMSGFYSLLTLNQISVWIKYNEKLKKEKLFLRKTQMKNIVEEIVMFSIIRI